MALHACMRTRVGHTLVSHSCVQSLFQRLHVACNKSKIIDNKINCKLEPIFRCKARLAREFAYRNLLCVAFLLA